MIKILTLLGNNYGGCLQAAALKHVIEKECNEKVIHINYTEYLSKKITIKSIIKNIIYCNRNIKFSKFKKKYLNIGRKEVSPKDDGSIYVVGSDQIWNPNIPYDIRKNFYLNFVKDKKRKKAYAASIGDTVIDNDENNIIHIKELLEDFDTISVREQTAEELLKEIVNTGINTVLDPTLLLTENEWDMFRSSEIKKDNYALVYTLGMNKEHEKYIDDYCKMKKLKIVDIFYKKRFSNILRKKNSLGPSEFITAIANSDFVITNSFHGTVFAIIYHKNFISITRGNMSSRLYDLLNKLGLQNRIIDEKKLKDISNYGDLSEIDYDTVDKILAEERRKSKKYLKESLVE